MKVFVWTNVLRDYSTGMAVAIAKDYETALMSFKEDWIRGDLAQGKHQVFDLDNLPKDFVFSEYSTGGG